MVSQVAEVGHLILKIKALLVFSIILKGFQGAKEELLIILNSLLRLFLKILNCILLSLEHFLAILLHMYRLLP